MSVSTSLSFRIHRNPFNGSSDQPTVTPITTFFYLHNSIHFVLFCNYEGIKFHYYQRLKFHIDIKPALLLTAQLAQFYHNRSVTQISLKQAKSIMFAQFTLNTSGSNNKPQPLLQNEQWVCEAVLSAVPKHKACSICLKAES